MLKKTLWDWPERLVFFLHQSKQEKLVLAVVVTVVVVGNIVWGKSLDNNVVFGLDGEEITEEVVSSPKDSLKKLLPQESPLSTALLFVSNLESRFAPTAKRQDSKNSAISGGPEPEGKTLNLETAGGSALVGQTPILTIIPSDSLVSERTDILTYEVEEGDNLDSIAQDFGISVSTLLWANNLSANTKIKAGDKISILPVDGVKHTIQSGDTIQSIALKYKADTDRIIAFNNLAANGFIKQGDVLIIPGGEFHVPVQPKYTPSVPIYSLPNLVGYYGLPAGGRVTYKLHRYNAIDLGGRDWCNTPVYAAAAGTIITSDIVGWNGGYGKYVKIAHDNGTITLYAHNSQNLVNEGQAVAKGQVVALMGSSGRATGCHVHFEVRGARNPLANY